MAFSLRCWNAWFALPPVLLFALRRASAEVTFEDVGTEAFSEFVHCLIEGLVAFDVVFFVAKKAKLARWLRGSHIHEAG